MQNSTQLNSRNNPISRYLIWNKPVVRWFFKPLVVGMIIMLGAFTPHTTTIAHTNEVLALVGLIGLVWGGKIFFFNQMLKG